MAVASAVALSRCVRAGEVSAESVVRTALESLRTHGASLGAVIDLLDERAVRTAKAVDSALRNGDDPGPLAGVPFAAKSLFDVKGIPTLSGSRLNRQLGPAGDDAEAVKRLEKSGGVLVATTNMDEYAHGFTTENVHYGTCRNPHDSSRLAGGSSGGSAAVVAAGVVPIALGTDTNGSIRVPSALSGAFGLKPSFGSISCRGVEPFAPSLDHIGVIGSTVADLSTAWELLADPETTANAETAMEPAVGRATGAPPSLCELRAATLTAGALSRCDPMILSGMERVLDRIGSVRRLNINELELARAASLVITAVEGSTQHLHQLRSSIAEFDPLTRGGFLAGALIPGCYYVLARRFRESFQAALEAIFDEVDVLILPTTPAMAPRVGQRWIRSGDVEYPTSRFLGEYTIPFSLAGVPVVAAPIMDAIPLPFGVQIIGPRGRENMILHVASQLEHSNVVGMKSNP